MVFQMLVGMAILVLAVGVAVRMIFGEPKDLEEDDYD